MSPRQLALLATLAACPARAWAQCQEAKLVASDALAGANAGFAVALDGATAVVGAYRDDGNGQLLGAAYAYAGAAGGWGGEQKLVPSGAGFGAQFGRSVAVDGDWIAVGAPQDAGQGVQQSGSVFLFERQGAAWVETQNLTAGDPKVSANFGWSLALQDGRLVVGAWLDATHGFGAGAAYVFELQGGAWMEVQKLTAALPEVGGSFGQAVALDGDLLAVGATGVDHAQVGLDVGAAYVFERAGGTWVERQRLQPSDGNEHQFTGWTVALAGTTVLAGAPGHDLPLDAAGAVYAFELQGGTWTQSAKLAVFDPQASQKLGSALGVHGDTLVAGTAVDADLGPNSGSAYAFRDLGGSWLQVGKLLASESQPGDLLGASVAVWGDIALAGAWGRDDACPASSTCNSGAAYAFRLAPDVVQYCSCPAGSGPCGNDDDHGGCANSSGQGGVLAACGSTSVLADDLVLQARWLPPSNFALLFTGGTFAANPFGDGLLCVHPGATGIHRYPLATTSPAGALQYGPGLVGQSQTFPAPGVIGPGDVRYFQTWYRDPQGACGSAVNLTNALRITFGP